MDADRFDAFVKSLSRRAARRGMVAGLLGGSVASLLAGLESEARGQRNRNTRRRDDFSAGDVSDEKRKRKKKKKHKKKRKPTDQAPPCTDQSCPLPPGCSQQVLDDCTEALFEALLADVEPCRPECEDPTSAACRACLDQIVEGRLPEAEACVAESCGSSASAAVRHRARPRASRISAREWWPRSCENATCCYVSKRDCENDATEGFFECAAAALAAALASPPAGAAALAICIGKLVYNMEKCQSRYGCPDYGTCGEGNICCRPGEEGGPCNGRCCPRLYTCCASGDCCGPTSKCCDGGGCCKTQDVCCRMTDGTHYCCSGEEELTCKVSGGPTCVKA